MRYYILIYSAIGAFDRLPENAQKACIQQQHQDLQIELKARGRYATAQLMPSSADVTLKSSAD